MTRAKASLHAKRMAALWARKANEAATGPLDPWWLGNARTYQRFMCEALAKRNKMIVGYLEQRRARHG